MELKPHLTRALQASLEAGKAILKIYETDFQVDSKDDRSPVTAADRAAHDVIARILAPFGLPLLSEEGKSIPYEERKHWDLFWMVDPLDGTKEFIKKNGEFTVNIALVQSGKPILGVIYAPALKALYFAAEGIGAYKSEQIEVERFEFEEFLWKSKKINVAPAPAKGETLRVVASRSHMSPETELFIENLKKDHPVELVSAGSSLKFCLVAEGKAHLYPRFGPTMEWDTAAGQAVVEQAGEVVVVHEIGKILEYNKNNLLNPWLITGKKGDCYPIIPKSTIQSYWL